MIAAFTLVTIVGTRILLPPLDYLPKGNRNLVFGLLFPPPGYNLETLSEMGERIEEQIEPLWEATPDKYGVETRSQRRQRRSRRTAASRCRSATAPAKRSIPPPLDNYFLVSFEGRMFHGGISADKTHGRRPRPRLQRTPPPGATPDTFAFAQQMPLFRVGGSTGSRGADRLPRPRSRRRFRGRRRGDGRPDGSRSRPARTSPRRRRTSPSRSTSCGSCPTTTGCASST